MKKIFAFVLPLQFFVIALIAQPAAIPAIDKSPADISYYPFNYPVLKINDKITEPLAARVIYGRPKRDGRVIFGGLVEYGKVWRVGANEATEIEFFKPAKLNGKKIAKGRYTLYAIPNETSWTIIINKETDIWGSFRYDMKKDLMRFDVPIQKTTELTESLGMVFDKTSNGFNLDIAWEYVRVSVPFTF
jgi:hypothetical protein